MLQWTWGWTHIFKIVIYFHLDVEIQKWDSWIIQVSLSVVSNSFWPMDCSMPGFPVHHQLPEFTQTHVHRVGDAIQLSHPPSSPSPPAFRSTLGRCLPSIRVFSNELVLCIRWPKYWSVNVSITSSNEYSRLISFSVNWLDPFAVQRTLKSLLQDHIPNPVTLDCEFFQCLGLQLSL